MKCNIVSIALLAAASIATTNHITALGDGNANDGSKKRVASYVDPVDDYFYATISDDGSNFKLWEFTVSGNSSIGGIRHETSDSSDLIKLEDVNKIEVLAPYHKSMRYSDQQFCLVRIHPKNSPAQEALFPINIVICGIEEGSNLKKSWFLNDINSIQIHHKVDAKERLERELKENEAKTAALTSDIAPSLPTSPLSPATPKTDAAVKKQYETPTLPTEPQTIPQQETGIMTAAFGLIKSVINLIKALLLGIRKLIW